MRKKNYSILLFLFAFIGHIAVSQQKIEISPYVGVGVPIGNFANVSKPGLGLGLSANYFFIPNLGIGLNIYRQAAGYKNASEFSRIPTSTSNSYEVITSENGSWSSLFFGIGPVYKIGSGPFTVDVYSKAGYTLNSVPTVEHTFKFGDTRKKLTHVGGENRNSFGLTSGARFSYSMNDRISFFLGVQHLYTSAKVDYSRVDIAKAFITKEQETRFDPGLLVEQPEHKQQISPAYLNTHVGVKIKLGGDKKTQTERKKSEYVNNFSSAVKDSTNEFTYSGAELIFPYPNETFDMEQNKRPEFNWTPSSEPVRDYTLILSKEGKEVYRKTTKEPFVQHNSEIEKIYAATPENSNSNFVWQVISNLKDSRKIESESNDFKIKRSSGAFHDVHDIECDEVSYNSDGSVNYNVKITFFNNISATHPLIISSPANIIITAPASGSITNLNSCGGTPPTVSFPITVPAGGSLTICGKFTVPAGTNSLITNVNGTINGLQQISNAQDSLKSCICTTCDAWRIRARNNKLTRITSKYANMSLSSTFVINNANPIIQVKAEVVSIRQTISNPACYTCTKNDENMGLMHVGKINPVNGWSNGGNGSLFDNDNNRYGNELTWNSSSAGGVNFNTPRTFAINLNLPAFSSLDCCNTTYNVCIRYTFTDKECNSCDVLVCYKYGTEPTSPGGPIIATPAEGFKPIKK